MFSLLGILIALGGCICLYLASDNQRWLRKPLPATYSCAVSVALLAASWFAFAHDMQRVPASFALGTIVMLGLAVLPYLGALNRPRGNR